MEEQITKLEEERIAWEARTRAELEKQGAAKHREAYRELEERAAREAEQTRKLHEEIAHAREEHLHLQETQVRHAPYTMYDPPSDPCTSF